MYFFNFDLRGIESKAVTNSFSLFLRKFKLEWKTKNLGKEMIDLWSKSIIKQLDEWTRVWKCLSESYFTKYSSTITKNSRKPSKIGLNVSVKLFRLCLKMNETQVMEKTCIYRYIERFKMEVRYHEGQSWINRKKNGFYNQAKNF